MTDHSTLYEADKISIRSKNVAKKSDKSSIAENFDVDSGLVMQFDDSDNGNDSIPDGSLQKFNNVFLFRKEDKGDNSYTFQNSLNDNSKTTTAKPYICKFESEYGDFEWDSEMTEESEESGTIELTGSHSMISEGFLEEDSFEMEEIISGEISDKEEILDNQSVTISNIFEVIFKLNL